MRTVSSRHSELKGKKVIVNCQHTRPKVNGRLETIEFSFRGQITDTIETESGQIYVGVKNGYVDRSLTDKWHRIENVELVYS